MSNIADLKELSSSVDFWGTTTGFSSDRLCEILAFAVNSVEQLEATERERDELRLRDCHQCGEILQLAGALNKAVAELARRDASAGEVVYQFDCGEGWQDVDQADYERYINARGISTRKVYTAALPAVVPPIQVTPADEWCLDDKEGVAWISGANWMRQQCLELGAQQQKVVELPDPADDSLMSTWQFNDAVINALDAAGVKWEVKK